MQLAEEVTAKYPQVEFWAVSCMAHRDVCANHTIRGYPTIHSFKAGEDESIVLGSGTNEAQIVKALQLDKTMQEVERKLALDEQDVSEEDEEKEEAASDKDASEVEDTFSEDKAEEEGSEEVGRKEAQASEEDDEKDEEEESEADAPDAPVVDDMEEDAPDGEDSEDGADQDSRKIEESEVVAVKDAPDVDDSEEGTPDAPAPVVDRSAEKGTDEDSPDVIKSEEDAPDAPDVDESEEEAKDAPGAQDLDETEEDEDQDSDEEREVVESDKHEDSDDGEAHDVEDSEIDEDLEKSDADEDEPKGRRIWRKQHDNSVSEDIEESKDGAPRDAATITDSVKSYRAQNKDNNGVKPGAGALKGKREPRDMDKWKQFIADSKKKFEKRKALLRKAKAKMAEPGATKIMKANTPGTTEYSERVNSLLKKINSLRKKRGVPPLNTAVEIATKAKKVLKKDIKEPRFAEKVPVIKRLVKLTSEEENILDASLSFIGGLKYGLFMTNDALTAKQKSALQAWLDLLSVSLPPEWGLHALIDELNDNIDRVAQGNENLLKILHKHPIPRDIFSASCRKHGSPHGFSCGLWKLFHTATVGITEHRGGLNLRESGVVATDTRIFSPADAAHAIREYIAHFFGCKECSNHFIAQYDQCSFRRCDRLTSDALSSTPDDWKQLPLWLWEVHNDVSVRVAHERTARHLATKSYSQAQVADLTKADEIKYLFPSLETCLQCFDENGSWDEDAVFEFLEATYWSGPDVMADKLLQYKDTDAYSSGSGFFWFVIIVVIAGFFVTRANKGGGSGGLKQSMNAALATGRKIGGKKRSV
jgi:hypothetical protein